MANSVQHNYRIQQYDHFNRVVMSIVFFVCLTLVLVYQLFSLQIVAGRRLYNRSLDNQFTFASLQSQRGHIYDRNGVVLAKNIPVFHLDVQVNARAAAYASLSKAQEKLQLSSDYLAKVHKAIERARPQDTIRIINHLTQDQLQLVYNENLHLAPLKVTPEFVRSYPCGEACATVTGYVLAHKIEKDQKSNNPNILASYSGADGVEKSYDDILSGQSGVVQLQRNAKGNILQTVSNIPALNGADIVLTIDSKLQKIIADRMQGRRGAVVINNPSNGEILGLYSAPSYDPNAFLNRSQSSMLTHYLTSEDKPLFNRALSGQFPPASTVKPFLALHALETKTINKNFRIHDTGSFRYKDTSNVYRNWNRSGHGDVNTRKAIIVSNDTFFYHLSLKLGIDHMSDIYASYGFGSPTGIDLPGDKLGLLPTRAWKKSLGKSWLIGDTIITGIGQGSLLVTPIQLAFANAVLAAQGKAYTPHVVKSIQYAAHTVDKTSFN